MIRKIAHISFAFLLLIITMGFSVSKHYCHNTLVNVQIDQPVKPCCGEGNCCHTETILVQLNDEAVSNAVVNVPNNVITQIVLFYSIELFTSYSIDIVPEVFVAYNSPPPPKIQTILSNFQSYIL